MTFAVLRECGHILTANDIAVRMASLYHTEFAENPSKNVFTEDKLIWQLVAEISSQRKGFVKAGGYINSTKKPFKYSLTPFDSIEEEKPKQADHTFSEHDMYPKLSEYLKVMLDIRSVRIDEKKSQNNRGRNANKWIHPDLVGCKRHDNNWTSIVKECASQQADTLLSLWSFEVKTKLETCNFRESFFQTVSNSSWANESYLVTSYISDNISTDLRILSASHGIGIIVLDMENSCESDIWLPAKRKSNIDWNACNLLATQNKDFNEYLTHVSKFYKMGKLYNNDWD